MAGSILLFSVSTAAIGHVPYYEMDCVDSLTPDFVSDIELSTVTFVNVGGSSRCSKHFNVSCSSGATSVFWEVVVPRRQHSGDVRVSIDSKHKMDYFSRVDEGGYPFFYYSEGWTVTALGTIAQFGAMECNRNFSQIITIDAPKTASFAIVIGEEEDMSSIEIYRMVEYSFKTTLWADGICPFAWFSPLLLFGMMPGGKYARFGYVTAVFAGIHDFIRFLRAVTFPTEKSDSFEVMGKKSNGPKKHSRTDGRLSTIIIYCLGRVIPLAATILFIHLFRSHRTLTLLHGAILCILVLIIITGIVLTGYGLFYALPYYPFVMAVLWLKKWCYDHFEPFISNPLNHNQSFEPRSDISSFPDRNPPERQ